MPSPNSQNLRSAPQKQPMPNMAVSKPSGYGPLSGRCNTKCSRAVGIGVERPGKASAADGISSFFLNMNMVASPVVAGPIYARRGRSASVFKPLAPSHPGRDLAYRSRPDARPAQGGFASPRKALFSPREMPVRREDGNEPVGRE